LPTVAHTLSRPRHCYCSRHVTTALALAFFCFATPAAAACIYAFWRCSRLMEALDMAVFASVAAFTPISRFCFYFAYFELLLLAYTPCLFHISPLTIVFC